MFKDRGMKKELNDAELETYARQIVLADIGYDGQLSLRNGKACIIGLGGLGNLVAQKLVAMGIGYLRIVDRDIVSRSDLHRQHLYDAESIGLPKVEVALKKLSSLNPDVELDPHPVSFSSLNASDLIEGVDVVLDGLDRPQSRYIINRTCNRVKIPYVFAGAIETHGNVAPILPGQTFCLECFMPGLKDDDLPKCGVVGVHPSILGIITAVQTYEAVRILMGREPKLLNKLLYIDLSDMRFHTLKLSALENCPVCGINPEQPPESLEDKLFEETCARDGRRNFVITPTQKTVVPFKKLASILKDKGYRIKKRGKLGITFEESDHVSGSILASGVMIMQTSPELTTFQKDDALRIYTSLLIDGLGLPRAIIPKT